MAEVLAPDVNHIHPLPDFIKGALERLPSEFLSDKENFTKLLSIFLERLRLVDEAFVDLAEYRTLQLAEGLNLNEIGEQMGIYRNGLADPEYRAIIMILSGGASKHGTRPEVISTLNQLFGKGNFATWKGDNFRFDLNLFNTCIEVDEVLDQLLDILPLVTHLRITDHEGYPFGFDNDEQDFGFGSVWDSQRYGAGGMASLIYVSDSADVYVPSLIKVSVQDTTVNFS
ncbi:hypothetical protein [Burkholderia pseudomallei]|jgi:hypothetical protein|uniref:hypothetical protein n=1 Tax=Burkholderia pseudomallei TaxID=28450 RepID=UPI0024E01147|nr:hypothetical protein [Burkholderia pseudomallei]